MKCHGYRIFLHISLTVMHLLNLVNLFQMVFNAKTSKNTAHNREV